MGAPILFYFGFEHLTEGPLRDTSQKFHALAHDIGESLPDGEEKTAALRHLLEAKDAAVRSTVPQAPPLPEPQPEQPAPAAQ